MAAVDTNSTQKALDMILAAIGLRESTCSAHATIQGQDPVLASRHRFGELMAAAQAAFGMALNEIWQLRGGKPQTVTTNVQNATSTMESPSCVRTGGSCRLPIMAPASAWIPP
jgi:hypothetical protein